MTKIKTYLILLALTILAGCSTPKSSKSSGLSMKEACFFYQKCFFLGVSNSPKAKPVPNFETSDTSVQLLWDKRLGNGTDEGEVKLRPIHNGKVLIAASERGEIARYNLESGEEEWQVTVGQNVTAGLVTGGGNVIVGTKDGWLEAHNLKTGEMAWRQQLSSEVLSRPAVVKNIVGVRTVDGQVSGVDARNGKILWKASIGVPQFSMRRQADMLTLGDLFLIASSKGRLIAFQARTGKQVISVPLVLGKGNTNIKRMSDFSATPFLMGRVLILSSFGQKTLAVDLKSQKVLWESPVNTALDLFADNRHVYIVTVEGEVHALALQTGKLVWKNDMLVGRRLSPADGNGIFVTVTDIEGYVYLLNSGNGQIDAMKRISNTRSNVGSAFFAADKFLSFSESGEISILKVNSSKITNNSSASGLNALGAPTRRVPTTSPAPQKKYTFSQGKTKPLVVPSKKKKSFPGLNTKKPVKKPLSFPSN